MDGWHHHSMDMSLGELWELVITGRPGMLQFMGSQRVGHDCATELTNYDYTVEVTNRFKGLDLIDRVPE